MKTEARREYEKSYRKANRGKLLNYSRQWYEKNREHQVVYYRQHYEKNKPKTVASTVRRNLNNTKSRAMSKGIPFDISFNDIEIPTHCPLLGIELKANLPRNSPQSPSIDKIIPDLGYVKGNVWVISNRANSLKSDASLAEIAMLYKNLKKKINAQDA